MIRFLSVKISVWRYAGLECLTNREKEVLSMISEGMSSQEVADKLCISKRTVDFHLGNIYEKFNVANRVQAVRRLNQSVALAT